MQKNKKNKKQTTLILIVSLIVVSSVFIIVIDIIKKSSKDKFHSFYGNKYSHKYLIKGVDVSHHNGYINWAQLKNEGVAFAYIKATEGISLIDKRYKDNYLEAKQTDIKRGVYHFYTFELDGVMQANHFIRHAKVDKLDLLPAIDVEHAPSNRYSKDKDYIKRVIEELQKLEQTLFDYYGVHPIIYTNRDCYTLYIKNHFPENLIWMSDLHSEPTIEDNEWVIWQFSHTGQLNGAFGDIDLNYFRYSYRQFDKLIIGK